MRRQLITITILVAFVCLSRIPVVSTCLSSHDSVNFALGIKDYAPVVHQPHPPGYPVYIGLAKLIDLPLNAPLADLLFLSILFSCVGTVLMYLLGEKLGGEFAGLLAALFLASSPLFWAFGAVPLSYTADVAGCLAVAYLCYRVAGGAKGFLVALTVVIALAAGVRQSLLVFFLPAWAVALVSTRSWPTVLRHIFTLFALCVCWAIPVVVSSGGLNGYVRVSRELYQSAVAPNLFSLKTPVYALTSTLWGLGASAAGLLLFRRWLHGAGVERGRSLLKFLLICWGPSVLFSFAVFFANPGYALVFLPCLLLISALAVSLESRRVRYSLGMGIIAVNSGLFLLIGPLPPNAIVAGHPTRAVQSFANFWALDYSRKGVADSRRVEAVLSGVKSHFSPESALVVVTPGRGTEFHVSPRVAAYYLSAFPMVEMKGGATSIEVSPRIDKIVWLLDVQDLWANGDGALVKSLVLGEGSPYSEFAGGRLRYGQCVFSHAPGDGLAGKPD